MHCMYRHSEVEMRDDVYQSFQRRMRAAVTLNDCDKAVKTLWGGAMLRPSLTKPLLDLTRGAANTNAASSPFASSARKRTILLGHPSLAGCLKSETEKSHLRENAVSTLSRQELLPHIECKRERRFESRIAVGIVASF